MRAGFHMDKVKHLRELKVKSQSLVNEGRFPHGQGETFEGA